MAGLSDEELGILSTIIYEDGVFDGQEGMTLGQILDRKHDEYYKQLNEELRSNGWDYDAATDKVGDSWISDEYRQVAEYARNDSELSSLKLAEIDDYDERGSLSVCFTDGSDAYVVYRGTGTGEHREGDPTNSEWYTDALGLAQQDTEPQLAAKDFAERCAAEYGNGTVTVTGHSNGGNKSMYVAITSDVVTRCVAFDGQGFSPEFFDAYADRILSRSDLVTFYGLEGDYVGPLMLPLPIDKIYVQYGDSFSYSWGITNGLYNLAMNHGMQSMFTFVDGEPTFKIGERSRLSYEIGYLTAYLCENTSQQTREFLAPAVGELLDALLGSKGKDWQQVLEDNEAQFALLFLLLRPYGRIDELVDALVEELGDDSPYLGWIIRELGGNEDRREESFGASGVDGAIRDFTEGKRQELVGIAKAVAEEPFLNPFQWDVWYGMERFFGRLDISNYQNDMSTYYQKIIDLEGITAEEVDKIFSDARSRCSRYATRLSSRIDSLANATSLMEAF